MEYQITPKTSVCKMQALNAALFVAAECCFTTALRRSSRVSFLKHECVLYLYEWIPQHNDMKYQLDKQSLRRLRVFKNLTIRSNALLESSHYFSKDSLEPLLKMLLIYLISYQLCWYNLDCDQRVTCMQVH